MKRSRGFIDNLGPISNEERVNNIGLVNEVQLRYIKHERMRREWDSCSSR